MHAGYQSTSAALCLTMTGSVSLHLGCSRVKSARRASSLGGGSTFGSSQHHAAGTLAAQCGAMPTKSTRNPKTYDEIVRATVLDPDSSVRPTKEQEQAAREG